MEPPIRWWIKSGGRVFAMNTTELRPMVTGPILQKPLGILLAT